MSSASGWANWDMGEPGSNQSHVNVCLITTDGYKYCTAVSGASIGEQARTESNLSLFLILQVPLLCTSSPASSAHPPTV